MPKTSRSVRPAAQVASTKKAADANALKATSSALALALIEGNEQELAEKVLTAAKQPCRDHEERSVRAARPPPARLDVWLLSKREVLAITGVTFPTVWTWMRAGTFPRSRVAGGKSVWRSDEVDAWLATLPVRRLKGDAPEAPASEKPAGVELSRSFLRGRAS